MASTMLLLTPEQARCNKELFQRAPAKLPPTLAEYSTAQPFNQHVSADNIEGALSISLGNATSGYPPPPNTTIFADEKFHEDVIATFLTTAMASVGYVPNLPNNTDAAEAAKGFNRFLTELVNYGSYLPLVRSQTDSYEHSSSDCGPLLQTVENFIASVGSMMGTSNPVKLAEGLTNMIKTAIESMGSSEHEVVSKNLYSFYTIDGDIQNNGKSYPVRTVFWSSLNMEYHKNGKSTVEKQSVAMYSYSYMILSPVVVANAEALAAATPVSVKQFDDSINANVPGLSRGPFLLVRICLLEYDESSFLVIESLRLEVVSV